MIIASSKSATMKVRILCSLTSLIIYPYLQCIAYFVWIWNLFLQSAKDKHFLYDIVANGRNGIDVDK